MFRGVSAVAGAPWTTGGESRGCGLLALPTALKTGQNDAVGRGGVFVCGSAIFWDKTPPTTPAEVHFMFGLFGQFRGVPLYTTKKSKRTPK